MALDEQPAQQAGGNASVLSELRAAAAFLTRLPASFFGGDAAAIPDFRTGARVFPVIGALVGLAGGVVLVVAAWLGIAPLVAALLAIATTAIFTGGLHEDGLADTADSFGGRTTEQKLAIMDDSRLGAFGGLAIVLSVGIRFAALASIAAAVGPMRAALVLIAAEAVSRAAMVTMWQALPPARTGGLSNAAGTPDRSAVLVAAAIATVIWLATTLPALGVWPTVLSGAFVVAGTWITVRVTARILGGRTGDTIGACQQIAVAAFLAGASAIPG